QEAGNRQRGDQQREAQNDGDAIADEPRKQCHHAPPRLRRATSSATAPAISRPSTKPCTGVRTPCSTITLVSSCTNTSPAMARGTEPKPRMIEMPPTTTAVMALNS